MHLDHLSGKKLFFGLTVHSVHPAFLLFKIIMLGGEQTVKGEQSIVHPDHVRVLKNRLAPVMWVKSRACHRTWVASRGCCPLSASGWFAFPVSCAASHNPARTP